MNFEKNFSNNESMEKRSLYQERQAIGVEKHIARIQKVERGEGKLNLSKEEKKDLLEFENEYAEKLENAFDIKINSFVFHLDYLQTTEGKSFFRQCMGFDVEGESQEEIRKFIYIYDMV